MPTNVSLPRMSTLSMYEGIIGVEGAIGETEIVVRIPMVHEDAVDLYYRLINME